MTLDSIYNKTVTIFNKLKRSDSTTGQDVWFKTVLNDVAWYQNSERTATANATYIGSYQTVLIPFHDEFLPYSEWKKAGNQLGHYTMSIGDYIVQGEVPDTITAQNIVKTLEKYGEDVCLVKYHRVVDKRPGVKIQLKIQGI